ncbi:MULTISPECIES: hypothetical protein [Gordonia]|uniref:Uncharacterized protein n=1 Tax=Gordonia sihwensis NBRC 108236 TaxID=1223544 RepID=L7LF51_9ACTN|nr:MULTISPECIES: hypothetical protein [Gordonia]AUH69788.1 hypothetical protein CXX93_17635 [Gordonia sp. YC-JH1]GAC59499.1 hypothetical protein GSI01S_02_01420 [Gordonia sihwensis NBRC 108236]
MALTADEFEQMSRITEQYTGRPWDGSDTHLDQTLQLQELDSNITDAHIAWLERARRRAHRAGREWNAAEVARQARIREAGE